MKVTLKKKAGKPDKSGTKSGASGIKLDVLEKLSSKFKSEFKGDDSKSSADDDTSVVHLWLDDYDDIFSDFDPRPYSIRSLSQDFLEEAKRASRDKEEEISLKFLLPSKKRNSAIEETIKKRLKEHFKRHAKLETKYFAGVVHKGLVFAFAGIFLMGFASLILFNEVEKKLLSSFLIIFLEPAGWFFFWEGLGMVLFESKKIRPGMDFYKKMAPGSISFLTIQEYKNNLKHHHGRPSR